MFKCSWLLYPATPNRDCDYQNKKPGDEEDFDYLRRLIGPKRTPDSSRRLQEMIEAEALRIHGGWRRQRLGSAIHVCSMVNGIGLGNQVP
jgi:hypothetical protein